MVKAARLLRQALMGMQRVLTISAPGDIVHLNFAGTPFTAAMLVALLRVMKRRVVLTVHDPTPHFYYLGQALRPIEIKLMHLMYRWSIRLVVHNQDASKVLSKKFGIDPNRISVIPHGPFPLVHISVSPRTCMTALLFGTLRQNKGIREAILATQQLRAEGKEVGLVIAGRPSATEAQYWLECKELITRAPEGIEVLDYYLEDGEVASLLSRIDFFLLPYSEFQSQSGVASLALSNRRALVATNAGGLADFARAGMVAVNIAEPSAEGIREAMLDALKMGSSEMRDRADVASAKYLQSYSWAAIAEDYDSLYAGLAVGDK